MALLDNRKLRIVLLTGKPGVGKTTLVKKLCCLMQQRSIIVRGFYTEEVRSGPSRIGFDIVTVDGKRGELARKMDTPQQYRVGQYGIAVHSFEELVMPHMRKQTQCKGNEVLIIDEIGKMELFSKIFKQEVEKIISSQDVILATVPERRVDPLIDRLKTHPSARLFQVDYSNRNGLEKSIFETIVQALQL